jgi:nucleotide-binding universal stress UspA family protein
VDGSQEKVPSAANQSVRFDNALVGVDGTSSGRDAIALADLLRDDGGRLTLAYVVLTHTPSYQNFYATPAWEQSREMLEREREAAGVTAELTGMFSPSVGSGLHQLAEDCDADLLVVGSCSRGAVGRVLVDDARDTVSGTSCPVAVAPHGYGEQRHQLRTIGVAYNDTVEADVALSVARSLAARCGSPVRALTVVTPASGGLGRWGDFDVGWGEMVNAVEQAAKDRLHSLDGVDGHVAIGPAAEALVAFGDEVDLLVVGSRGFGPLRRLILGSTSLQLTREARCPLVVVPRPAIAPNLRERS